MEATTSFMTGPYCFGLPISSAESPVTPSPGGLTTAASLPPVLQSSPMSTLRGSSMPQPTLVSFPGSTTPFYQAVHGNSGFQNRPPPRFPPGFEVPISMSTGSFTPASVSPSPSSYYFQPLAAPNVTNLVTVQLSSPEDYLHWKTQFTCLLVSHQLLGVVEGTLPIPSPTFVDDQGNTLSNPQFYEYLRLDQSVRSWIYATVSRDVLTDIHDLHTSSEVWNRLKSRFMNASMARSMELKGRLSHIKKGEKQSMDAYLREIKVIADSLAAIQCPVTQKDLVQQTLYGLNSVSRDYDSLITTLTHFPIELTFDELRPYLKNNV